MAEEKFYKYVILRDRDGNYLLPYSGTKGLADVAFTGKYRDLIDKPVLDSFLPAAQDEITGYYNVGYTTVFLSPASIILEDTPEIFANGDLAKDMYVVNEDYIYKVENYLLDSYKDTLDDAYEEASQEAEPEEPFPKTFFCGYADTLAALNDLTYGKELYDIWYVRNVKKWYMCVLNDSGVKIWVDEYKNRKVRP